MKNACSPPKVAQTTNLDEWVRHIVDIHFHPEHGAPFWIDRARELRLDPGKDIRSYDDLRLLGFFPMDALRMHNVLDFLPADVAKDRSRLRVYETGGTTGSPGRLASRNFFDPIHRWMDWYLDEAVGFPRGENWLFIGPTGPHAVADSTREIAQLRGGMCYFIDLDPRFIRVLLQKQDMRTMGLYMEHIRRQVFGVLDTQQIGVLGTTPALIQMLAPELKERGYTISGFMYGGTNLSKDLYQLLHGVYFPNAAHTAVYGNTLMGGALLRPLQPDDSNIVYYGIEPLVKFEVLDLGDPNKKVGLRETGQICFSVLSEERFLPRVLERDQAERWDPLPLLGYEGVANVRPLASLQAGITEGVY